MADSDPRDDTSADYERFAREQLAQDRDARRPSTADLDDETAQDLIRALLDAGTVRPLVDERVLVHEPSGAAFESLWQLAVFHEGWTAAVDASEAES